MMQFLKFFEHTIFGGRRMKFFGALCALILLSNHVAAQVPAQTGSPVGPPVGPSVAPFATQATPPAPLAAPGADPVAPSTPPAVPAAIPVPPPFNFGLPDLSWVPPPDTFDWVQLKSGEWLKGTAKAMQDDELEFDSEEVDEDTFDWKDIRQLRTGQGRVVQIKFINGNLLTGGIVVTPTQVLVNGTETRAVPRGLLQSFTRGGPKEWDYWSGKVDLGLTIRSGNSDQSDYNGQAHFKRRTPTTRFKLDYIGNISESDQIENANNHRVNGELDVWVTRHFYLVVPFAEYFSDPFQNIATRNTVGLGVGYDIVDRPKLEWTISTGPGYQKLRFSSTQPGESDTQDTGVFSFGSEFSWDITSDLEWSLEYRGQFTSKEAGGTTHHAVNTISIDLTKRLDIDFSFVWDRIEHPTADVNGVTPLPDDYRFVISLALDF
jgi:putative salt-induced outer membrane protein YdiY